MMNLKLIPKFEINIKGKCDICVQVKQPRKPFPSIERNTQLLELICSDTCNLNNFVTCSGK